MRIVRLLAIFTLAVTAWPQSYPSAWNYANPNATFLLGFDWSRLQQSAFAGMAQKQISTRHAMGLPDPNFLEHVNQILLAISIDKDIAKTRKQPPALLILSGTFDLQVVRKIAISKKMSPSTYHSVPLLTEAGKPGEQDSALALINEQTLLFGDRRSVLQAIDRNAPGTPRVFSPIMASASKLAETHDLWIIAHNFGNFSRELDGPLQIGQDVTAIQAGISFHNGLDADAALTAISDVAAARFARMIEALRPQLPKPLQDLGIATKENVVQLALSIDQQQLTAMLGKFTQQAIAQAMPAGAAPPHPSTKPEKMTIKIYGLDDGPKEIPYPASN
ncbi:MAG TPA: hypothetical protein VKV15_11535 [Bryobacteraceae bacterium]|nr:hypothetical protein [Bryobacteraceae bacterium]